MRGINKPKDRDLIETTEGFIFCVVGYLHPPDRYTAYLKYVPAAEGKWSRGETNYSRVLPFYNVSQVENTYTFLKEMYPKYLYEDPVMNITISSVPYRSVRKYYIPEERLTTLINEGATDPLERKLLDLVELLKSTTGVHHEEFGITGSILLRNHNISFSDIDITIYGLESSTLVKKMMHETRKDEGILKPFSNEQLKKWCKASAEMFSLSCNDLEIIARRRWNYSYYDETYVSFHPVRTDYEIRENYGDYTYRPLGNVRGTAKITNSEESMFLPAIYEVENVCIKETDFEVKQLVSFEGIFCDIFRECETVEFAGTLEEVTGKENYYRVIVGGSGSIDSFIKLA